MSAPVKYLLIGGTVLLIAVAVVATVIGPKKAFAAVYFSLLSDTEYSSGYSNKAFGEIEIGDSEAKVIAALGAPLSERKVEAYTNLLFSSAPIPEYGSDGIADGELDFTVFTLSSEGKFQSAYGQVFGGRTGEGFVNVEITIGFGDGLNFLGIKEPEIELLKKAGATRADIEAKYGKPNGVFKSKVVRWMVYSKSPSSGNYQRCWIGVDAEGNVTAIKNERYWD